jgi:ankyrin repeat protein
VSKQDLTVAHRLRSPHMSTGVHVREIMAAAEEPSSCGWWASISGGGGRDALFTRRRELFDIGSVEGILADWRKEMAVGSGMSMTRAAWRPKDFLRARAFVLDQIRWGQLETIRAPIEKFDLSPHVLSDEEAALLAEAARTERWRVGVESGEALWDPTVTFLVFALRYKGEGAEAVQQYLVRRSHARGGAQWTRDLTAKVPDGALEGLKATFLHMALSSECRAVVRLAVDELGVDPLALPPFLGRHSLLCFCAINGDVETLRLLLSYCRRRGRLDEALSAPCCAQPVAVEERLEHVRELERQITTSPYALILHAIEAELLPVFDALLEAEPGAASGAVFFKHPIGALSVYDFCALHAWLPGLERLLGREGEDVVWEGMEESDRHALLNCPRAPTGKTALHFACHAKKMAEADILAVVRLLLGKGANPLLRDGMDGRGHLPAQISRRRGHRRVENALAEVAERWRGSGAAGAAGGEDEECEVRLPLFGCMATGVHDPLFYTNDHHARRSTDNTHPQHIQRYRRRGAPTLPATSFPPLHRTGVTLPHGTALELKDAGERGDVERLQKRCRLWDKSHPDAPGGFGTDAWVAPLWAAASRTAIMGRMRVLAWLVEEKGVRVHRLLPGEAALIQAADRETGLVAVIFTPLASAVFAGQEAAALYLLKAGLARGDIDPHHDCGSGWTVLHLAAMQGASVELVAALVDEGGFNLRAGADGPETALYLAAKHGHLHLLDFFLARARALGQLEPALAHCMHEHANIHGVSLTWAAIEGRQLRVLKHLGAAVPELDLSRCYTFYTQRVRHETPAFQAAAATNLPALRFLLGPERHTHTTGRGSFPFDINGRDPQGGNTLLHAALWPDTDKPPAESEVLEMVAFLLERGGDPTVVDGSGRTPLDVARQLGLERVARRLEEAAIKGQREEAVRCRVGSAGERGFMK